MARIDNRGNLRGSARGASSGRLSRGSRDLLAVSKSLKAAGQTELRKELHKTIRTAAKPLLPKIRESARASGPKGGELNEWLAKKPYRAQVRTGAKQAGVRIVGTKVDPRINSLGRIQHPVYGRRPPVVQYDEELKGYFDKPLKESGPAVSRQVVAALDAFTRKIVRGEV